MHDFPRQDPTKTYAQNVNYTEADLKKSQTCEEGGAHLRILHLLMNFKNR